MSAFNYAAILSCPYLVELELCDNNLGGSDGDRDGLAVALLADDCIVVSVGCGNARRQWCTYHR
jgi:hypothetical protein